MTILKQLVEPSFPGTQLVEAEAIGVGNNPKGNATALGWGGPIELESSSPQMTLAMTATMTTLA
jgi:hypothetical protein